MWDFTPFLYPDIYELVKPPDHIEYKKLIQFRHKSEVIDAIEKEGKRTFILSFISYNIATFSIFKAISKKHIPYSVFTAASPGIDIRRHKDHLAKRLMRVTPNKIVRYVRSVFSRIPPALLGIRPATLLLIGGGTKSLSNIKPTVNDRTDVLWIHSLDFDIYLNNTEDNREERNIAVFLDEYYPFHHDEIFSGIPHATTADEYYPILCRFFDYIEKELNLEVVVAAHPRSHYEKMLDFFQGRRVIRGKTVDLVKGAKLVILHSSNSLNFAVLYRKPMVFITTDRLDGSRNGKIIRQWASNFNKTPINISRKIDTDLKSEMWICEEYYKKYTHNFIKAEGTEELPFWQIVANKIKSIDL